MSMTSSAERRLVATSLSMVDEMVDMMALGDE
jgi:hypothetical protein